MQRVVSNIQNLGFTINNAPSEDKKVRAGGIILDQTLVNGVSEGVSVRLINGSKKTAAVKKDAVLLQRLAGTTDDADQLWSWARAQPVERIVVKRPLRAPLLGPQRPSHTLSGKSVRFDVFVHQRPVDLTVGIEV